MKIRPLIIAIDDDLDALERTERELQRRFGADYRIRGERTAKDAAHVCEEALADGRPVALILADQWLGDETGDALLTQARAMHPSAKRALLIEWRGWADPATAEAIHRSMAIGDAHYYVIKPWQSPDELFNRTVSEFLQDWTRSEGIGEREVIVVADRSTPRAHELRSFLTRNGVPHFQVDSSTSEGRRLLEDANLADVEAPVVFARGHGVLVDPTNAELARSYGVATEVTTDANVDVLVIGAGPAGLAAAINTASEGLTTMVVEQEAIGGQSASSAMIRNYPGFPRGVSGAELAQRAFQQAWVLGTKFTITQAVTALRPHGDHVHAELAGGATITAESVVIAVGVDYRELGVESVERLRGAGVFYGASAPEAIGLQGASAVVIGGGNSAGQAVLHLARYAKQVTLVVRQPSLEKSMSKYLIDEIAAAPGVQVLYESEVVEADGDQRLEGVHIRSRTTGETTHLEAQALFVLIGADPRTTWLPDEIRRDRRGFILTGVDLDDDAGRHRYATYETSFPGIFAVGDVRAGSVKRVASAVGEGAIVTQQIHQRRTARALSGSNPA